jgi:hypothetical protein
MARVLERNSPDGSGQKLHICNPGSKGAPRHASGRNGLPSGQCIKLMAVAISGPKKHSI